ncbi:hypothetical protein AMK59_8121 [Oryctes borbonicus]|uniref:Uncharacterized protein n=1 Tax=Oryctes borbonicus TaxID=1629725 RepID=A0A0T6AUH8_9SCAR|nr:hypothetical protein AMK59_8121 [Oryctes borbonicus]
MGYIISGKFGRVIISSYAHYPLKYGNSVCCRRGICSIWTGRALDRSRPLLKQYQIHHQREYGMLVLRAVRGLLKVRYLILGGAVGGGVTLQKKYQDWKDGLPDLKWLEDVMPDNDKWHQWRGSLIDFKNNVKDNIEIDPRIKAFSETKYKEFKDWFDQRLDNAIAATDQSNQEISVAISGAFASLTEYLERLYSGMMHLRSSFSHLDVV